MGCLKCSSLLFLCKKSKYFDLCGAKVVLFFDMCKKMANFLLGELAPSTKLVAGGKFPNIMGGVMDKDSQGII